jgi:hypothetical protein
LKRNNPYISIVFAFIAAFGITVSSIHLHELDEHDADTKHVWVAQDDIHCVICGSIFKTTPDHGTHSQYLADSDIIHFSDATEKAQQPFERFQEGRSPPLFS